MSRQDLPDSVDALRQMVYDLRSELRAARDEAEVALGLAAEAEAQRDEAKATTPNALLALEVERLKLELAAAQAAKVAQPATTGSNDPQIAQLKAKVVELTQKLGATAGVKEKAQKFQNQNAILKDQIQDLEKRNGQLQKALDERVALRCGCVVTGIDCDGCTDERPHCADPTERANAQILTVQEAIDKFW